MHPDFSEESQAAVLVPARKWSQQTCHRLSQHCGGDQWIPVHGAITISSCTTWCVAFALALTMPCVLASGSVSRARNYWARRPPDIERYYSSSRRRWSIRDIGVASSSTPSHESIIVSQEAVMVSMSVQTHAWRGDIFANCLRGMEDGVGYCRGRSRVVPRARGLFCRGGADFGDRGDDDDDDDGGYDETTTDHDFGDEEEEGKDVGSDGTSEEEYGSDEGIVGAGSDVYDDDDQYGETSVGEGSEDGDGYYEDTDFTSDGDGLEEGREEADPGRDMPHKVEDPAAPAAVVSEANGNSVHVCVMTWNLAEESPPASDVDFLRKAAEGCGLVAVGVQEIEDLKPRRNEGRRTREWRRLLLRTLGREFVRVGHHAMGGVQLTLFARREILDRVKVIKLTEVACGVGNVLQNKGGIGAFVRVDRTTFLFIAAHLAAHQGKLEERNSGYWRIVTTLNQEIPPAWLIHAARKRAKRLKASAAEASAATAQEVETRPFPAQGSPIESGLFTSSRTAAYGGVTVGGRGEGGAVARGLSGGAREASCGRGPFEDRVDRVFFFGDLNYRVDLSREDIELGAAKARRGEGGGRLGGGGGGVVRGRRRGVPYPGAAPHDALLDFDQLTLMRSQGKAFGGFLEARVTFEPTYKYDKGSRSFDTSRKMRPPAWTDRILFSSGGPSGISSKQYNSVPGSRHSDHRPVYATFRVRLEGYR